MNIAGHKIKKRKLEEIITKQKTERIYQLIRKRTLVIGACLVFTGKKITTENEDFNEILNLLHGMLMADRPRTVIVNQRRNISN